MIPFTPVDPVHAEGRAKAMLEAVKHKLGIVPNMTRHLARAPAVLDAYLAFASALAGGSLGRRLREQIALVTAEENRCEYCLSAHAAIGKGTGLTATDIADARRADASDARARAALRFARVLVAQRGHVAEADVADLRAAGFTDGETGEVIANVALNVFTNYFNNVTRPAVDFPRVSPREVAQAA